MQLQAYVSTSNLLMRNLVHLLSDFLHGSTHFDKVVRQSNRVCVTFRSSEIKPQYSYQLICNLHKLCMILIR